jgi:TATA-box binding protein (TBP) (component of TFIID and TFIIIB)
MSTITNIKVSLKVLPICLDTVCDIAKNNSIAYKKYNNFIVLRNEFTYIIFKNKKGCNTHINITKLRFFSDIEKSKQFLNDEILHLFNSNVIQQKIDNITASYDLKKNVNILETIEKFIGLCEVRYNNEKFPGVFLKHILGTIIVFHSGKTILIGSKDINSLKCLTQFLIVNMC